MLAGIVEHHLVEFGPRHLPGLRAFVRLVIAEVKRLGELSLLRDELHAVLFDKPAPLQFGEHAEPLEHPEGLGDQRFADVIAGEMLALEQLHPKACLGDERRDRSPGRTATDHHNIGPNGVDHHAASF